VGEAGRVSDVVLSFRAPSADVRAVRLRTDAFKRQAPLEFRKRGRTRTWELRIPRPDGVTRLEYELEVERTNGTTETVVDPENPLRASAPFGERSVLELDGYERPVWLDDDEAPAGTIEPFSIRSRLLRADVDGFVWSVNGVESDALLPLLVVHDGPEYAEYSTLLRLLDHLVDSGETPEFRALLLPPGPNRDEVYSASLRYANALAADLLPAAAAHAPSGRPPVLLGASLGALAGMHAHFRNPGLFGGFFLQSGSFFRQRLDAHESGFTRFGRITRFVGQVHGRSEIAPPLPTVITCGTAEENLDNNRAFAAALERRGWPVKTFWNRDAHNWTAWRDALHPHLAELLLRVWT
jgi:enterochelin esterase-like enzyme